MQCLIVACPLFTEGLEERFVMPREPVLHHVFLKGYIQVAMGMVFSEQRLCLWNTSTPSYDIESFFDMHRRAQ